MAQGEGKITFEKPYLGWIPTPGYIATQTLGTTSGYLYTDTNAYESTLGLTSDSFIQYPMPTYQDYSSSQAIMINRPGFEGHIAPGPGWTDITDNGGGSPTVNGLALNAMVGPDGNCYVILDSNRYVILNLSTQIISNGNFATIGSAAGGHSGHTGFTTVNGDICIYPITTNGTYTSYRTYATWEDSTDGDIAQINGNSVTASNYYSGTLSGTALISGVPHPLLAATSIDQNVYFGNGSALGRFNPIALTHTDQALLLQPGFIINGLTTYGDYIAIIAYRVNNFSQNPLTSSQAKLFLWDGFSPVVNFQYDLQDNFVSNIFNDGKNLYFITYGRSGTTKLKKFNGTNFDTLWETAIAGGFPGGTTSPNPCFGGMDLWLNHVVWSSNSDGHINAYGSPAQQYPIGFHNISLLGTTNGMCKNLFSNLLFVGNKSGATYTIKYADLTKYDSQATFKTPIYPLPTNSSIVWVKAYFSSWPKNSTPLSLSIMKDYNISTFGGAADLLGWQLTGATNTYYLQNSKTIDNVNSFYLAGSWSLATTTNAPIIRKIEVGFSYETNNI